ncbi:MAG: Ig-like domain-containing protein [Nitrospinota bacterium]|nr:Ig-like domain-containing protein [Nitrospinota bacterium]
MFLRPAVKFIFAAAFAVIFASCGIQQTGNEPSIPQNVVATAAEPGIVEVTLTWNEVFRADSYNIYWVKEAPTSTDTSTLTSTDTLTSTSTDTFILDLPAGPIVSSTNGTKINGILKPTYTHKDLEGGSKYYYVVTAVSRYGESKESAVVNATPIAMPAAPTVSGTTPSLDSTPVWTWFGNGGGNGTFRYAVDDETAIVDAMETTELTYTPDLPGFPNGVYTLYVQERNDFGDWSISGYFDIKVDGPVPSPPVVSVENPPKTKDPTPTWSWVAGGGGNGTFRYKLDDKDLSVASTETTFLEFTPTSALTDGPHTLYVQERDEPGNWSDSGFAAIIVDTTPPNAPVVTGSSPTDNTQPTWSWTPGDGDGVGTYRYRMNNPDMTANTTETTATSLVPSSPLADGTYTLYVQERDELGNWSDSGSKAIIVDTTAPDVTVDPLTTNDQRPPLSGTVTDNDPDTVVTLVVNGQAKTAVNNGDGTWILADNSLTVLPEGVYDVKAKATDTVGLFANDATTNELDIDLTPPVVTVNSLNTKSANPELTGNVDDITAAISVKVGAQAPKIATNNANGSWTLIAGSLNSDLTDGTYEVLVTALDVAGNSATDATTNELLVDLTKPVVTVDTLVTNNNRPQLTGTVDDNGATISVVVNAQTKTAVNNGNGTWTLAANALAALTDNTYDVAVTATDGVGNAGTDATFDELLIDQTLPSAPGIPTDDGLYTSSTTVIFTWAAGADMQSGVASYNLQVGTAPGGSNIFSGDVGNVLTKDIAGSHGQTLYARVQSVNGTGDVSPWSGNSDGITIDTSPPGVPGVPTDAGVYTTSTTVTFIWTGATDADSGVTSYNLQVGTSPGGSDIFSGDVGNVLTKNVTGSNGNTLYARVQAVNGAGSTGAWSGNSNGITIDTTSPTTPGTPTDIGVYSGSTTVTFNWTAATDPESTVVNYYLQVGTTPGGSNKFNGPIGNVLTYDINGVTGDILYARVQAENGAGTVGSWSGNSDGITIDTTAPSSPGIPSDAGVYSTSTSVTFNWTPAVDGNSGVTSYYLQVGTSQGGSDIFNGDVGNVLTKTVTGSHSQTLYARVQAVNGAGLSGAFSGNSDGITIDITQPSTPGTPTDGGTYTSNTTVTFSWVASADAESGVASYVLQVGTTPGGSDVFNADVGNVLSKNITGNNGDTLYAKVQAVNGAGTAGSFSANSDGITIDTSASSAPGIPTDAGLWSTSATVTFNWAAATDAGSGIASYNLQVGTAPGGSDIFSGNVGNVLTKNVTGVDTNTLYARVQAVNGAGLTGAWSGNSDGITIDITLPTAPGTPTDAGVYSQVTTVTFSWGASADVGGSGVASYELQVGTIPGGSTKFSGTVGNVLTKDITGADGETLFAKVRAVDTAGNIGAWSGNSDGIDIDTTPPSVTIKSPASGATNVAIDTKVIATFSEPMDTATIDGTSFTVTDPVSGGVAGTLGFSGGDTVATFTPNAWLPSAKAQYSVDLAGTITDPAGNALPATSWNFTSIGKVAATDPQASDGFGEAVAISGDYMIVGAPYEDAGGADAGAAYIYKRDATYNSWGRATKIVASDPAAGDNFGKSVAISGSYAIVGASGKNSSQGVAYVYKLITPATNTWSAGTKILSGGGSANGLFGKSVSISGLFAIVGAPQEDPGAVGDAGAAYVFMDDGSNTWGDRAQLLPLVSAAGAQFGFSVAIDGDNAMVGAPYQSLWGANSGAVHPFNKANPVVNTWTTGNNVMVVYAAGDKFGYSVALSASYALVGAIDRTTSSATSGAAFLLTNNGTNSWTGGTSEVKATTPVTGAAFGNSVAINGNNAVVGSYLENGEAGAAYTFLATAPTVVTKVTPYDAAAGDRFGMSVGTTTTNRVVGAPQEDPGSTSNAGSAYINP